MFDCWFYKFTICLVYILSTAYCDDELIISPTATANLSCQVQRTISQPVTGQPQCPDSNTHVCPNEIVMCSCFGEGAAIEWRNTLFSSNLDFTNTGSTMVGAHETDDNTGATALVTAVNPRVNITTDLTLNVTTTAAVNAMEFNNTAIRCQDASGPIGGMEQTVLIYGRFMHDIHTNSSQLPVVPLLYIVGNMQLGYIQKTIAW